MNPARTIFAILFGYLALIVLQLIGGEMLGRAVHGRPGSSAIIGGEIVVFAAGIIAGAITARLAPYRPLSHATALGLAIASATTLAAAISKPPAHQPFPNWYPYAAALLSGVGAFVGGALASMRSGDPPEPLP